ENWGIGIKNTLPWKLKKDMAYFERVTKKILASNENTDTSLVTPNKKIQNAVIMGRKTWESIPLKYRPLKDRLNVVLSRNDAISSLTDKPTVARIFIIGGGEIYKEAIELPLCEYILLTKVYKNFNCDAFFPKIDENLYELASHDELVNFTGDDVPKGRQVEGDTEYEFLMYKRNKDEGDDGSKPNERSNLISGDGNSYVELISCLRSLSLKFGNRKPLSLSHISDVKNKTLIPPNIVLSDGGLTKEDQTWLHKAMDEIHAAIDHIEVEYVGDLVVSLT
ncbi:32982_t:CDS:2, partial [Racocetra persica]